MPEHLLAFLLSREVGIRRQIAIHSRCLSFRPEAEGRRGEIWLQGWTRPTHGQMSRLRCAPAPWGQARHDRTCVWGLFQSPM